MTNDEIFEVYIASAKDSFTGLWPNMSEEDVEKYFGVCKGFIKRRFEEDVKLRDKGEISDQVLQDGCGRSVGWCLGHCYDTPMD